MNTGGSSSTVSTNSTPGFTGSLAVYADNASAACMYSAPASGQACMGTSSNSTSAIRPNIVFTGNKSPSITDVSWSDGSSVVGTGNPLTVTATATTTYSASITSQGCVFALEPSLTIIVNALLPAVTATNSAQCGTQIPTASVASNSTQTSPTFNWYDAATGGTLVQTGTSATYTDLVAATTTFYVSEVDAATSCETTPTAVTVTVANADNILAESLDPTVCVATAITLDASNLSASPNQNYTYSWTDPVGSGAEGGLSGATVMPIPTIAGTHIYELTGVDGGCTAVDQVSVDVDPFEATVSQIAITCNGGSDGSFQLATSSCSAGGLTYSVNGGAGSHPNRYDCGFLHNRCEGCQWV